jgi:hypothetical protein
MLGNGVEVVEVSIEGKIIKDRYEFNKLGKKYFDKLARKYY